MDIQSNQPASTSIPQAQNGASPPRKSKFGVVAIVLVALILAVIAATLHKSNDNKTTAKQPAAKVSVTADSFFPSVIDISAGQQITWTNQDTDGHWVASDPYPKDDALKALNSGGPLQKNESYTYTFEKAGTYTYHDELHPYKIQGTVRVK